MGLSPLAPLSCFDPRCPREENDGESQLRLSEAGASHYHTRENRIRLPLFALSLALCIVGQSGGISNLVLLC